MRLRAVRFVCCGVVRDRSGLKVFGIFVGGDSQLCQTLFGQTLFVYGGLSVVN